MVIDRIKFFEDIQLKTLEERKKAEASKPPTLNMLIANFNLQTLFLEDSLKPKDEK